MSEFDFSGIEVTQNLQSGRTPRFDVNWKRDGNFKIGSYAMTALGLTGSNACLTGKSDKAGVALLGVVPETDQRAKYVKRRGDSNKTGSFRAPELADSLEQVAGFKAPYEEGTGDNKKIHNVPLALELVGENDGVTWYKFVKWNGVSIAGDADFGDDVEDDTQDDDDDDIETTDAATEAAPEDDFVDAEELDEEDDLADILED